MLYGANGSVVRASKAPPRAERQEAQEEEIRAKLKSLDSLLDIQYIEWAGRYSLICQWPSTDNRWKMYQSGEIGDCYDSLGWFCEDMHDGNSLPVSLDSIENKVMELLSKCDNERTPWKKRMNEILAKNAKVRKDRQAAISDKAADIASTVWQAVGRHDDTKVERILKEISNDDS